MINTAWTKPATRAPVGRTPNVLQDDTRVAKIHHLAGTFIDYLVYTTVNTKSAAAEAHHFCVKCQASIFVILVDCLQNFVKGLDPYKFPDGKVQNLCGRRFKCA